MTSPVGADRRRDLDRFYELLDRLSARLGGPRCLRECSGADGWTDRGVYFFFEESELREGGPPRVVRVGTHAVTQSSQRSLWRRLADHRGTLSGTRPGGGNHRGSIFRLHVGTALLNRDPYPPEVRRAWNALEADSGFKDTEHDLERAVSDHIGRLPFLWLAVPDAPGRDSHRAYIEANAIGLLSNFGCAAVDPPSPSWLGQWANAPKVRESGLWNVNHVDGSYTPGFLDVFESYADGAVPRTTAPPTSR